MTSTKAYYRNIRFEIEDDAEYAMLAERQRLEKGTDLKNTYCSHVEARTITSIQCERFSPGVKHHLCYDCFYDLHTLVHHKRMVKETQRLLSQLLLGIQHLVAAADKEELKETIISRKSADS